MQTKQVDTKNTGYTVLMVECPTLNQTCSIVKTNHHKTFSFVVSQAWTWWFWSRVSLLARQPFRSGWWKTCFIVGSGTGGPTASSSWQACALVVPGLFLIIRANFFSAEDNSLDLPPNSGPVFSYLEMALRDLGKYMILFLRSRLSSLDFFIVLCVRQPNKCFLCWHRKSIIII